MRGYFGIGVYHPKHEVNVGGLWRHAQLYGAAFIFTIGKRYKKAAADTGGAPRHIPMYSYLTFEEFLANRPYGSPLVAVEQAVGAFSLPTFVHPERAIYLLGAEDHGIPGAILDRCNQHLEIPAPKQWSMNMSHAGTLVMYDRWVKQ